MQSFSNANLRCCECQEKFSSAAALLHHFARHALVEEREKQGNNKYGEGNSGNWQPWEKQSNKYGEGHSGNWQPWRCDDIFKTKRRGHNFLETALLSIHETCRKKAKLQAATPLSTSSENSSHSLTEKSETSETTALSSIHETCRKKAKLQLATSLSTSSENSSHSLTEKSETSETETKGAVTIVQENQILTNKNFSSENPSSKYVNNESKGTIVHENHIHLECSSENVLSKYTNNKSKGTNNRQSLTNNCSSENFSLKNVINESKGTQNCCDEELVEDGGEEDRSNLVQIIKLEEKTSITNNNEFIVKYPGPECIVTPILSTNPELPLELSASEKCFNRTNDDCDVDYDNDDNNINLDVRLGKVNNCDNNNVIIYNNDNSQDKLPKIVEGGGKLDKDEVDRRKSDEDSFNKLTDSSVEERKIKLSNRKQTTPKKIERNENRFVKIAPRPENSQRVEQKHPNKKGTKKKYCCPLCSRVFGWSTDLKRHILVHTGERPFKCSNCTSSFTRKFLLQKHQTKMHPLNGKTERERLLELKVSENLKQLKTKMLELQKSKVSGNRNEPEHFKEIGYEEVNEEINIKVEPPYETFFKTENSFDENWDSTSNNNNNNNNVDNEIGYNKACKTENIVFVEPIIIQSS